MNVIFLDIDGVMNSKTFYINRYKKRWFKFKTYKYWIISKIKFIFNGVKHKYISDANYKINPKHFEFKYTFKRLKEETNKEKWEWLSSFCNENNYKICISSVWRNHFKSLEDWNKVLIKLGFNNNIFVGITGKREKLRGIEIKNWIKYYNIDKYAILDDDSDMLPEQLSTCFFHVDPYYGLSPNHLYRINLYFRKN
jgi:hypothetical protein